MNTFKYSKGFTHGHNFHADDVLATAFLKILNPDFEVERQKNRGVPIPTADDILVYDIGFGKFDHHQENAEIRENGIPYAAFGLIVREFGELIMNEEELKFFDETFVSKIDDADNGGELNLYSSVISSFNPSWDEEANYDERFNNAVEFAKTTLENEISRIKSKTKAREIINEALNKSKDGIVVLEKFAPWQDVLVPSESKFIVFKGPDGEYKAQVIPTTLGGMDSKVPFPERWYGKNDSILKEELKSMTFCHKNGFIAAFKEKEDAIEACRIALKEYSINNKFTFDDLLKAVQEDNVEKFRTIINSFPDEKIDYYKVSEIAYGKDMTKIGDFLMNNEKPINPAYVIYGISKGSLENKNELINTILEMSKTNEIDLKTDVINETIKDLKSFDKDLLDKLTSITKRDFGIEA